jgi:hypothetical protein
MKTDYFFSKGRFKAPFKSNETMVKNEPSSNGFISSSSAWLGLFFLTLSLLVGQNGFSQVSGYAFSQSSGTFTAPTTGLVGATGAASTTPASIFATAWDDSAAAMTLPFTFTYNGAPFTQVAISSNGFFVFGSAISANGAGAAYTSFSDPSGVYLNGTSTNNGVAGLNLDQNERTFPTFTGARTSGSNTITGVSSIANLKVGMRISGTGISSGAIITAITATTVTMSANATGTSSTAVTPRSAIYAAVSGTSPNRTYIITTIAGRRFGNTTDNFDFQYILSEADNSISVVYGSVVAAAAANGVPVGIRSTTSDFNSRTTATNWATTTAGVVNTDKCTISSTIFPASGLTFKWTYVPPACPTPNSVVVTLTSATTASVSWSGAASAVVEWGTTGCAAGTGATAGACGTVVSGSSPQTITGLTLGSSYTVYVRQDCTGSANGYSTNVSTPFTATAGESCAITQTISVAPNVGAAVNTLLTTGLTSDGPNGTCSDATGNSSKKDRWVSFVAPSSGNKVIISTVSGTITDAVMQVWSACPATGVALGCSDDVVGLMPQLEFCSLTPGDTYYVQIWPYSATATGNFNIRIYEDVACAVPPANDECAGVETILVGAPGSCPGAATSGTTVDATATPGIVKTTCDAFGTYNDVFYKFNSGSNISVDFAFTNLTGTNEFGIYGDCGLTYLGVCSSSSLTTNITGLTANTDYYVVVWANSAAVAGTFSICISSPPAPNCVVSPSAPTNGSTTVNPCAVTLSWPSVAGATSYDVFLDAGAGPATTLVSPAQTGTSYVAGLLTGTTSYSWRVVPKNGTGDAVGCSDFTFTTTGAPGCVTTPTSPAEASTICAGATSFSWPSVAGATTYDVYIDAVLVSNNQAGTSYSQAVSAGAHTWSVVPSNCIGDATGCIDFTFTANPSPTGDVFATAIDLGVITASTSVNGDNQTSNCWRNDYTTSSTPGNSLARESTDVFYKFEITECGSLMDIGTCTSSFDTYIHLLDSTGARINGDDDACTTPNSAGSFVSTLALNPGVYYVVVEGFGTAEGTFTLDFTYVAGTPQIPLYADIDGDGFGNPASSILTCDGVEPGYVTDNSDCNDNQIQYFDGDNDGYGTAVQVACGVANNTDCNDNQIQYADVDGDGFGSTTQVACGVTNSLDCNDNQIQYFDGDGDNYGTAVQVACGAVLTGDCNDSNAAVNPGAVDVCYDGIDNDCNGIIDNACTPIISTIQATQCGVTLATINQNIFANLVAGAQGYRFTVTDMTTNQVQTIDRALRVFNLTQLSNYAFDRTYQVQVSIRFNNVWQPFFGAPCMVTTPATVTQIQAAQCDGTLTTMGDVIFANNVPFVTGYRFRITNLLTSVSVVEDRLLRDIRLTNIAGFTPEFNTTYSVEVAIRNTNGLYLQYNPVVCNITTPSFPTTQLQLSQCDVTISNPNTTIFADSYAGATTYRFKFTSGAFSYITDRPLRSFILSSIPLPGAGAYSVQVSIEINGVFGGYGKICTLTIPGGERGNEAAGNNFQAIASPNPFASTFGLNLSTTSEEQIQVRVYDMLGKLVEDRKAQASDIIELGDNYPSGVYNVIVSQGENTKTLRVIKR